MANEEHLAIFNEGGEVWNKWREEHPEVKPDLSEIEVAAVELPHINFFETNLKECVFEEVNFESSNFLEAVLYNGTLSDCNLTNSNLSKCNLAEAELLGVKMSNILLNDADLNTNFFECKMTNANLTNADLSFAHLHEVDLKNSDFTNAHFYYTVFSRANLSNARGLESANFYAPCSLDVETLLISGELPLPFLRGCGLPDSFIEYLPSLLGKPLEFYSCFISYSSKDQDFADRLYADLQNNNVRCWFDKEDLRIGDKFRSEIHKSIRLHDKLLVILSKHSVRSEWVEDEVERALERERKENKIILFPVRIDGAAMEIEEGWPATLSNTRQIGDFTKWKEHDEYQKGFDRLLRDLKSERKK